MNASRFYYLLKKLSTSSNLFQSPFIAILRFSIISSIDFSCFPPKHCIACIRCKYSSSSVASSMSLRDSKPFFNISSIFLKQLITSAEYHSLFLLYQKYSSFQSSFYIHLQNMNKSRKVVQQQSNKSFYQC